MIDCGGAWCGADLIVAGALVACTGVTLLVLGICVFGRALKRVTVINRGINEVVLALTALDVGQLTKTTATALAYTREARGLAMSILDGQETDVERGLGNVDNFRYDADAPTLDMDPVASRNRSRASDGTSRRQGVRFADITEVDNETDDDDSLGSMDSTKAAGVAHHGAHHNDDGPPLGLAAGNGAHVLALKGGGGGGGGGRGGGGGESKASAGEEMRFSHSSRGDSGLTDGAGSQPDHNDSLQMMPGFDSSMMLLGPGEAEEETTGGTNPDEEEDVPLPAGRFGNLKGSFAVRRGAPQGDTKMESDNGASSVSTGSPDAATLPLPLAKKVAAPHPTGSGGGSCPINHLSLPERVGGGGVGAGLQSSGSGTNQLALGAHGFPTFEAILAASPGVVVVTDAIGEVRYVNSAFSKLFGYSKQEIVGQNITIIQPPEIANGHDKLMSRVVEGGTPRVVGVAGRQVSAVHKDGHPIPSLLVINRIDVGDEIFFVANMQDTRAHNNEEEDDEDQDQDLQGESRSRNRALVIRVVVALACIASLQAGNFLFGSVNLRTAANRAVELNKAGALRTLSTLLTFSSQELVIGDGQLWTLNETLAATNDYLDRYERIRFGLRFGNDTMHLPGSAGRSDAQDWLLFGGVDPATGVVVDGLDSNIKQFQRHVKALLQLYGAEPPLLTPVGRNITALELSSDLNYLKSNVRGAFEQLTLQSITQYSVESKERIADILLIDDLASVVNVLVVLSLYVAVLRTLVNSMRGTARRTENMLLSLPEDFATRNNKLRSFFKRANATEMRS